MTTNPTLGVSRLKLIMDRYQSPYEAWYCGTAVDARDRLANDHNVDLDSDPHAIERMNDPKEARSVERQLLDLGCCSGDRGAQTPHEVYVYLSREHTNP